MEYVGGKSLKQIRLEARQRGGAVPLPHALAYALEILPAFGYLHDRGLVYCDFKPDNIIQTEEQLKLIDMGGVRYIDDDGPIYGTVGYQAPEIETDGPSPSSDLYTVGRTLAVLTFEFAGFQGEYQFRLPEQRAAAGPAGVLRPAAAPRHPPPPGPPVPVGGGDGRAADRRAARGALRRRRPAPARVLRPVQPRAAGHRHRPDPGVRPTGTGPARGLAAPAAAAEVIAGLPAPLADGADPAAGYLATLAGLEPAQQAQTLLGAVTGDAGVPPGVAESPETRLALVRALIAAGDLTTAPGHLAELSAADPADWRVAWYGGLCELAGGRPDRAAGGVQRRLRRAARRARAQARARLRRRGGRATRPPRGTTSSWCGPSTGPTSAPRFGAARACLAGGDRVGRHRRGRRGAGDLQPPRRGPDRRRPAARRRRRRAVRGRPAPGRPAPRPAVPGRQRPAPAPARGGDPAGRARLGVGRRRPPRSGAAPAARRSASSAASRTSARCASGSSAATARSPACSPSGGSSWWTWPTASARGRGFERRGNDDDCEETAMTGLPGFTVDIDQNPYLPVGGRDVSAIVTVTADGRGDAPGRAARAATAAAREIVIIDCSGSMDYPPAKLAEARAATAAAVDVIRDGTWFAIVAGTSTAWPVYPPDGSMAVASERTRAEAKAALRQLRANGGTAIGQWLRLAHQIFQTSPGHAAARHLAHRRQEPARDAGRARRRDRPVRGRLPLRLPRRRHRLGGRRAAQDLHRAARHGRHRGRPGRPGGRLRGADARRDEQAAARRAAAGVDAAAGRR